MHSLTFSHTMVPLGDGGGDGGGGGLLMAAAGGEGGGGDFHASVFARPRPPRPFASRRARRSSPRADELRRVRVAGALKPAKLPLPASCGQILPVSDCASYDCIGRLPVSNHAPYVRIARNRWL
jgi:hypothetical protein